jgi:hypothetical protein
MKEIPMKVMYSCHCVVCYHCGGSGWVSAYTLDRDRIERLAEAMAVAEVNRQRLAADANEDGEGWSFRAAETGCSVYEYTRGAEHQAARDFIPFLHHLLAENPRIARALLDAFQPHDREVKFQEEDE